MSEENERLMLAYLRLLWFETENMNITLFGLLFVKNKPMAKGRIDDYFDERTSLIAGIEKGLGATEEEKRLREELDKKSKEPPSVMYQ